MSDPRHELDRLLTDRLEGTRVQAFWRELLTQSGHILILKLLTDAVITGPVSILLDIGDWIFTIAIFIQAACLSQLKISPIWGNFIGVGLYTLVDWPLDGADFWQDSNHQVFWLFAIIVAVLRGLQRHGKTTISRLGLIAEHLTRSMLVLAFYIVISQADGQLEINPAGLWRFFWVDRHEFLVWSGIGIGLLLGMQAVQIQTQRQQIRQTTDILRDLAAWGMGDYAVTTAMRDPDALDLQRRDRAIVFMDVRSFTRWCEITSPDRIAALLDHYYQQVEAAASTMNPVKISFTGDEVMAIYATPHQALQAACAMQIAAQSVLAQHHLGAGCGIHWGKTIEGLFGGDRTRTYTTIGDTVNTAKRIEGKAPANTIVVSDAVYHAIHGEAPQGYHFVPRSPEIVKGKADPLILWQLQDSTIHPSSLSA
jgi:class 3 adenylate cyclase